MIVCGERRFRAHQLLGAEFIRAEVIEMTDDQLADAAIIENMQRADISPLEEAKAFQARLDTGLTVEELAKRLGLKQPWRITERTNLLKLVPEMQQALALGAITPAQAYEMTRLNPANQKRLFEAIKAGKCPGYKELRVVTAALLDSEKQVRLFASEPEVTEEEKACVSRLERRIEQLCSMLADAVKDNELAGIRKLNPLKFRVYVEQLTLIEAEVKRLRLALAAADVARAA
jgi:ParB family chromosome partitioning protein